MNKTFRQALIIWYVLIIIPKATVAILKEMVNMKKQTDYTLQLIIDLQQIIKAQSATIQELEVKERND